MQKPDTVPISDADKDRRLGVMVPQLLGLDSEDDAEDDSPKNKKAKVNAKSKKKKMSRSMRSQ